jgi:hypothetical protein
MKARLEFDINDFDEVKGFKRAIYSTEMACFIWDLKLNVLRKIRKDELSADDAVSLINDLLNELPFDIEDLIN